MTYLVLRIVIKFSTLGNSADSISRRVFSMYLFSFGAEIAQSIQQLHYGLDTQRMWIQFPVGVRDVSLVQSIPNSSGAHPTSCIVITGDSFHWG
jgi:hypothetical protein